MPCTPLLAKTRPLPSTLFTYPRILRHLFSLVDKVWATTILVGISPEDFRIEHFSLAIPTMLTSSLCFMTCRKRDSNVVWAHPLFQAWSTPAKYNITTSNSIAHISYSIGNDKPGHLFMWPAVGFAKLPENWQRLTSSVSVTLQS